jgi:hypothetical protein
VKLTLEPTSRIVEIQTPHGDVVPGRVWQGRTAFGVEVVAVVTRIAAIVADDNTELEAVLTPVEPCRAAIEAFPMRMIL